MAVTSYTPVRAPGLGVGAAPVVGQVRLANTTAPDSSLTDGVILYAEDEASSSELKVRDEAGNVTTLSPHNFSLLGRPSEVMAWSFYGERTIAGRRIRVNVDMMRLVRLVEQLSGERLVYMREEELRCEGR